MTARHFLESTLMPFALSFVASHHFVASPHFIAAMPTGARSLNTSRVHFSKLNINCAKWRQLTHQLRT
jgi:hypothetical protein